MTSAIDTKQAVLQAIIDEPHEDLHRMVFADLLEEEGELDRAEFIRHQITHYKRHVAGIPHDNLYPNGDLELAIVSRMPDFLCLPGQTIDDYGWNGTGTTRIEYANGAEATFSRGFVSTVHLPLAIWLKYGPALVRTHPIEKVDITNRSPMRTIVGRYGWSLDDGYASDLPDVLWNALRPPLSDNPTRRGGWSSQDTANTGLSEACIFWAKSHPIE